MSGKASVTSSEPNEMACGVTPVPGEHTVLQLLENAIILALSPN
jgi:hypothetical protein